MSVSTIVGTLNDHLVTYKLWAGVKYLSVSIDSTTMILVEENQKEQIPMWLQRWPCKVIEHVTNATSVSRSPEGPAAFGLSSTELSIFKP